MTLTYMSQHICFKGIVVFDMLSHLSFHRSWKYSWQVRGRARNNFIRTKHTTPGPGTVVPTPILFLPSLAGAFRHCLQSPLAKEPADPNPILMTEEQRVLKPSKEDGRKFTLGS